METTMYFDSDVVLGDFGDNETDYDFEDVDCVSCGLKFYIRPSLYTGTDKKYPEMCSRCQKGLPPLYEY
jgi:hypothetical protein